MVGHASYFSRLSLGRRSTSLSVFAFVLTCPQVSEFPPGPTFDKLSSVRLGKILLEGVSVGRLGRFSWTPGRMRPRQLVSLGRVIE